MRKLPYIILSLALIVLSFVAGSWYSRQEAEKDNSTSGRTSPINAEKKTHSDADTGTSSSPSGAVKIGPEKQQLIGVRIAIIEKKPMTHSLRILGRVSVDETRIYRLNSAVEGWIREVGNNSTGSVVRKDETLATIYSPEFLAPTQAYIYMLTSLDRFQATGKETLSQIQVTKLNLQQYIESLRNLGMSDLQIKEIERTRQYTENIRVISPATSFILARNISPGQRFERGLEFYRLADLSRVWVLADVFENEALHLKPGMKVRVTQQYQKKVLEAMVSDVLPQFDPTTRTLKVRLEVENLDFALRPDMFVDVELPITFPPTITVPADAILDSGIKKTLFVDRGNGFFEPREVETGWRIGNRVEIVRGLEVGEKVVTSGTFLIDSESKLELAAQGMYSTLSKDPVCGIAVAMRKAEKAGLKASQGGKTYYFHSEECKQKFEKDPNRYIKA